MPALSLRSFDDTALLTELIAGNDTAFESIYHRYADKLFSYGSGFGFEKEVLEDAIQDIFYQLYTRRKDLNIRDLKFYLLRALKNHLLNHLRLTPSTTDIFSSEFHFSSKSTVLDELIKEEERQKIQAKIDEFLACLTDRQREAVYLRFIEELSCEEIADLMQMSPASVRNLISRAMRKIRDNYPIIMYLFPFFCR